MLTQTDLPQQLRFPAALNLLLIFAVSGVSHAHAAGPSTFDSRRDAFLASAAERDLPQGKRETTWVDSERWSVAHACLAKNVRLHEANQYLSEVAWVSLSRGLVADTDIQVTDLLRTWFEFKDDRRLDPPARTHLKEMLTEWTVPNRDRNHDADVAYQWPHEYTENHSLNIVVAKYLIDASLGRDRKNSQDLAERFLADRARWGWSEFNSTRYGMVTCKTLTLLADFAPDESVRLAAKMHLDLIVCDYATHSLHYWRGLPAARGASHVGSNRNNAILDLARLWFGDPDPNANYAGGDFLVHFLTSSYRPPEIALQIQKDAERRGRYAASQVCTSGPSKLRVPITLWVTPFATMTSAPGFGAFYEGSYASISFASSPDNVIHCTYGRERNIFQHRNVMATFGEVAWHGRLKQEKIGSTTIGTDGKVYVGQLDLPEGAHLLMVADDTEYSDSKKFAAAFAALQAKLENGVLSWKMPDGAKVEMFNQVKGGKWRFTHATVSSQLVRIDRNLLFDNPFMRSVRDSRLVEIRHGGKKWLYDFRDQTRPKIQLAESSELTPLLPDETPGPLGLQLVSIPAGEFPRGSSLTDGRSNEQPLQWVFVGDFLISKTEVTVGAYREYLKANPKVAAPPEWYWKEWGKTDRYAMTWVTHAEAVAFCDWLSRKTGDTYRLPTEAEWEKAAKGFSQRQYPWGDDYDGTQSGSENMTYLEVGSKPLDRSPFGVLDMAGNVWEWCGDWYDSKAYTLPDLINPRGPKTGKARVVRSCGWNYDPDTFRISFRSSYNPSERTAHIGFRIVREVPQAK